MPDAALLPAPPESLAGNGSADGPLPVQPEGPQRLANGQFAAGWKGGPGRTPGSKNAAKCLDRAAPKLARHMIARSFKSDSVLCKTMDKILPDAGTGQVAVNLSLNYAALSVPAVHRVSVAPVDEDGSEWSLGHGVSDGGASASSEEGAGTSGKGGECRE